MFTLAATGYIFKLTHKGYLMKQAKHITLFSESDIFGSILFANEAFCDVSKYKKEELVGKPHNIIRHPEMPGKLFEVMWSTIKAGKTFKAIIKNRAKDGAHYWVECTILPILSREARIIKYISVRHLIADSEQPEQLYAAQMKQFFK
jgi:PAS domain S-box-containing protein